MQSKMELSKSFLHKSPTKVVQEKQVMAQIIEEGIPPPPFNSTYFHIDNEDEVIWLRSCPKKNHLPITIIYFSKDITRISS